MSLMQPMSAASQTQIPTGRYHHFRQIRFYRPMGYAFQGHSSYIIEACEFDAYGQPDLPWNEMHFDSIGGGNNCDAMVLACSWRNSAGNYCDIVQPEPNQPSRLMFTNNVSSNHLIGGIYAAGSGSVISYNRLSNRYHSSIGYDADTHESNRSQNVVMGNVLENISVFDAGLSAKYKDKVRDNTGPDSPPARLTPPESPLVSGAAYQNTNPYAITIYQPVYAEKSGTEHTVSVFLNSSSGLGSPLYTEYVADNTSPKAPAMCVLRVQPGEFYAFTTRGVALGTARIQGE